MSKWYFVLIALNACIPFMPQIERFSITTNRPLMSLITMIFISFLVPNNLSIDTIGGEKHFKTAETLFSTPLTAKAIFMGKSCFILMLGCNAILWSTILNNGILKLAYNKTYFNAGISKDGVIIIYFTAVLAILIIAFVGFALSLVSNELKVNGYVITVLNIVITIAVYQTAVSKNMISMYVLLLSLAILSISLFAAVTLFVKKQHVMKYIK
jgi:ABC-type transport system involved in multi-copper enzyme maturation permease subunit